MISVVGALVTTRCALIQLRNVSLISCFVWGASEEGLASPLIGFSGIHTSHCFSASHPSLIPLIWLPPPCSCEHGVCLGGFMSKLYHKCIRLQIIAEQVFHINVASLDVKIMNTFFSLISPSRNQMFHFKHALFKCHNSYHSRVILVGDAMGRKDLL